MATKKKRLFKRGDACEFTVGTRKVEGTITKLIDSNNGTWVWVTSGTERFHVSMRDLRKPAVTA